jgi:hypothetical protein
MGFLGVISGSKKKALFLALKISMGSCPKLRKQIFLYSMANTDVYKYYINIDMYT